MGQESTIHEGQLYFGRMMEIVRQAGSTAMSLMGHGGSDLKKDHSIITEADRAISRDCRASLADVLSDEQHLLIDEEDGAIGQYLDNELLARKKYIWALDPIDGTRLYANRMPLFGVSLGVMKDLKPWLGVVYFPAIGELFYCDGVDAYFVQNAFSDKEVKTKITVVDEIISPRSIFFCNDTFFEKFGWNDRDFHIMIHACAVVNLCWPTIGRGCGSFLRCHIWDFAGSWPIILKAGYNIRSVVTGKILDKVDASFFTQTPKSWQMKEYHLISSQQNFDVIRSKIVPR